MDDAEAVVARLISQPWTYPGLRLRAADSLRLSIATKPSLEPWACWTIFETSNAFVVRRIEWDRRTDHVMVPAEAPSTFACDGLLPLEAALSVLTDAHQFALLPWPVTRGIVLDGTTRHVCLAMPSSNQVDVKWAMQGQTSAKHDALFESCAAKLELYLPASTTRRSEGAA